jgi:hypothetical protein
VVAFWHTHEREHDMGRKRKRQGRHEIELRLASDGIQQARRGGGDRPEALLHCAIPVRVRA